MGPLALLILLYYLSAFFFSPVWTGLGQMHRRVEISSCQGFLSFCSLRCQVGRHSGKGTTFLPKHIGAHTDDTQTSVPLPPLKSRVKMKCLRNLVE